MISKGISCKFFVLFIILSHSELSLAESEAKASTSNKDKISLPCLSPGGIEHGLTDWNGTGDIARFACYQGFYLVGPPQVVCRYGRWYSDAPVEKPTCKPVVCSHPNIAHGSLASGENLRYRAGKFASVICEDGYELRQKSNNKLICKEDGSWTASQGYEFPQCQEKGCLFNENVIAQPDNGHIEVTGRKETPQPGAYSDNWTTGSSTRHPSPGVYRPGSVLKYICQPGSVVVPVVASTRVCRRGSWDGQAGQCVRKSPNFKPRGSCPSPPFINNGYYLSERYNSGEKPYVLPVSGHLGKRYEVGAIARYHCDEGFTLLRLFGQDIYRCTSSGVWSPKQPPVCISKNSEMEPLDGMMCGAPDDVAYANYRAVEGVVTPNGALHGTILEYACNIGYRDTILPCLPSRRTCHAGQWVGALPSCAPFEFCPPVPRIQNGYLATPREETYKLHSIVKYGCDRGFWMAGTDTMQCQATGCWEPNALPKCIDENLLSTWSEETGGASLVAILISVCGATAAISAVVAICGVMVCRRKRYPPPNGPAHWSTHVTVTPDCRNGSEGSSHPLQHQHSQNQNVATATANKERVALIAYADQDSVVLPSYEEALNEEMPALRKSLNHQPSYRQHGHGQPPPARRPRPPQEHHTIPKFNGTYPTGRELTRDSRIEGRVECREVRDGRIDNRVRRRQAESEVRLRQQDSDPRMRQHEQETRMRQHEPDTLSHTSWGTGRQQPGSNTASLRSGSIQSVETAGNSEGTSQMSQVTSTSNNTETSNTSQTPSCRALAGSLASFDTSSIMNTEGIPLLEENEVDTERSNSASEQADTMSAYSESSTKSR